MAVRDEVDAGHWRLFKNVVRRQNPVPAFQVPPTTQQAAAGKFPKSYYYCPWHAHGFSLGC